MRSSLSAGRRSGALFLLVLLAGCGDPGPYGYGTSPAETAPHAAHARGGEVPRGVIRGVIELAEPIPGESFDCVFLMGRRDPAQRVPDLVQKLPPGPFPLAFEVTARDLAGPGTLSGDWHLDARLDRDGSAGAEAGDLVGRTSGAVSAGASGAVLVLRERVTETDEVPLIDLTAGHGGHAALHGLGAERDLPPGHPTLHAAPPVQDAAPAAAAEGPRFRGRIEVAPDFASRVPDGVLYVMVRQSPAARGMPRAVLRVDSPTFPVSFDIGSEHVPLDVENKADMLLGTLYLSARLDQDGNALTKQAGDLEMSAEPLAATANGEPLVIRLDVELSQ